MGLVPNETIQQYAEGAAAPVGTVLPVSELERDLESFSTSPSDAIHILKQAKELYAAGSLAEADALIDRVINVMQAAFDEHLAECEETESA